MQRQYQVAYNARLAWESALWEILRSREVTAARCAMVRELLEAAFDWSVITSFVRGTRARFACSFGNGQRSKKVIERSACNASSRFWIAFESMQR